MSYRRKMKRRNNKIKSKTFINGLQELLTAQQEFGGEIVQKENGDISWLSPWEFSEGFFDDECQGDE